MIEEVISYNKSEVQLNTFLESTTIFYRIFKNSIEFFFLF